MESQVSIIVGGVVKFFADYKTKHFAFGRLYKRRSEINLTEILEE